MSRDEKNQVKFSTVGLPIIIVLKVSKFIWRFKYIITRVAPCLHQRNNGHHFLYIDLSLTLLVLTMNSVETKCLSMHPFEEYSNRKGVWYELRE